VEGLGVVAGLAGLAVGGALVLALGGADDWTAHAVTSAPTITTGTIRRTRQDMLPG
jgi:hypothetical protein